MTIEKQKMRLEGIYPQRQKEFFMQRIKLPAGIISAQQALRVADIAKGSARGLVHLTTRGSIELHWLTRGDLTAVAAQLAQLTPEMCTGCAAVRPATRNHMPAWGMAAPGLLYLTGLGSRGMMSAPYAAQQLCGLFMGSGGK